MIDPDQSRTHGILQDTYMMKAYMVKSHMINFATIDWMRNLRVQASRLAVAGAVATSCVVLTPILPAQAEPLTPSVWLDQLDRDHNKLVSPRGHVHARGRVQAVDAQRPGSITILVDALESADRTIRMPAMEMPFHVTNWRMLQGLRTGDMVDFEAARLKNAVMITNIRKAH